MSTVQGGPGNIIRSGLVLNLDASNPRSYPPAYNGTTWFNLSGTNNGTLTNGPTYNTGSGGSIVFDGTNDYVGLGTPTSLNITGSITINSWVNLTAFPSSNNATIYEKGYDNTNEQTFFRFNNQSSITSIDCGTFSVNNYFTRLTLTGSYATLITTGSWNNIVGQYDGANWNLYVNGTLLSQTTTQGPKPSTAAVSIGAAFISTGYERFINGRISAVQVYNRALTASEVNQNFQATRARFGI